MSFLTRLKKATFAVAATGALTVSGITAVMGVASAQTQSATEKPRVSFTFDDGFTSPVSKAAPVLAEFGFSGTSYVVTDCVGMVTAPNTCHANNDATYMNWDDLTSLQFNYGWEIGSHTKSHPYLATSDPGDQPFEISDEQVVTELAQAKGVLNDHGFAAESFASPYGDYDQGTLEKIAQMYTSQRGFADVGYNVWPYSDYFLQVQQVQAGVSLEAVKGYIDQAIANDEWVILVFHDIKDRPSNDPYDYEYSTQGLRDIAAYVKSKNVEVANVSDALVDGDTSIIPNGSFEKGLEQWATDNAAAVTVDDQYNGAYPLSQNSVRLTSVASNVHLFSPKVTVSSDQSYVIKTFLNVKAISSGAVAFYIDEYDVNGNWISGQYKTEEGSRFVQRLNMDYTPTTARVRSASLQVIVTANSEITAYLDTVQWFALNESTTTPPTNLIVNGQFDSGIAAGWSTNFAEGITADGSGNGAANGFQNSVRLTSDAAANKHLFGPRVAVEMTGEYTFSAWLHIQQLTAGQAAFYIDEYDVNGNWISGQYKTDIGSVGQHTVTMGYAPSSADVASASLQVIVTPSSGLLGYIDDVQMIKL